MACTHQFHTDSYPLDKNKRKPKGAYVKNLEMAKIELATELITFKENTQQELDSVQNESINKSVADRRRILENGQS